MFYCCLDDEIKMCVCNNSTTSVVSCVSLSIFLSVTSPRPLRLWRLVDKQVNISVVLIFFEHFLDVHRRPIDIIEAFQHNVDITIFRFLKMAAVCRLGLFKVQNFNCQYPAEGQFASSCQISCRSVKPLPRYGSFSIFQDGGRPPSWICYMPVWTTQEEYLVVFVILQNLVGISAVV